MSAEDEKLWRAVNVTSDRLTELEAIVEERKTVMRDTITEAVRDAMPTALMSDEEHRFLQNLIALQAQRVALRRKIIESSAIWGVILLAGWALLVFKDYLVLHGWKP